MSAAALRLIVTIQLLYWALLYVAVTLIAVAFPEEFAAQFSAVKAVEAACAVLAVSVLLGVRQRHGRPSEVMLHLVTAFLLVPICVYYALRSEQRTFFLAVVLSFGILAILVRVLPAIALPRISRPILAAVLFTAGAVTIYVYGSLVIGGALTRLNLDFEKVYVARSMLMESGGFVLAGYLVPWQGYVINPALLVFGIRSRSVLIVGIALAAQVVLFAMANFKSFLFAPLLVAAIVLLGDRRRPVLWVYAGALAAVCAGVVAFAAFGDYMTPSISIRRLFLVPAKNHFLYFDWFSQNPHVMLSNSIFSWFVRYPYEMPVTRVISYAYYGRDFAPNVGYLGDAYAHFGVGGMVVFSVLLAGVLRLLDSLARYVASSVAVAITVIPFMALMNSGLLTTILTHGLGLSCLLVWCLTAVTDRNRDGRTIGLEDGIQGNPAYGTLGEA